jgi:hypothetical protein
VVHLNELYRTFEGRAHFFMVYISEAHPNVKVTVHHDGVTEKRLFPATESAAKRSKRGRLLKETFGLKMPVLVDEPGQGVEQKYHAWPYRLVVIDPAGDISLDAGMEPSPGGNGLNLPRVSAWMAAHL